jgi:hypothetical protein
LIKALLAGIVVGALGTGALAWYVPAVDLHRERSLISVVPNGGNHEYFYIGLPGDRIMVGLPNDDSALPADLAWPGDEHLPGLQAEIFKLRDKNSAVVGVASRLASAGEPTGPFIEWIVHLPARGTLYVNMDITPDEEGLRAGTVRAGTNDFATLTGTMSERLVTDVGGESDVNKRIELKTFLVGQLGEGE